MMTSPPVTQQQQTDGRTVREVVEFNQELVNEVWCRRIFRQILQSLELQYAMQLPHRPITPDTVLVLGSGDPMLLPAPEGRTTEAGEARSEADDLHDLAAVVHYAITREYPPAAPLEGRVAGGNGDEYSAGFLTAVDRCLSPDPQQRPHTIEQLRNLLGIVPLGPAFPAQPPSTPPEAALPYHAEPAAASGPAGLKRWLLIVAAATVLLAALGALFALLHQADSRDTVMLALPDDEEPAAAPPEAGFSGSTEAAGAGASSDSASLAGLPSGAPPGDPHAVTIPPLTGAPTAGQRGANGAAAAAAGATYKLVIKPWAMVHVNGVDYGASPPLKRLHLAPGQHTIRIVNPSFPGQTVTVDAVEGATSVIEMDFSEEELE